MKFMGIPVWALAVGAYFLFKPKDAAEGPATIPPRAPRPGAPPPPAVHGNRNRKRGAVGGWASAPAPLMLQPDTRYFARLALSPEQADHADALIRGFIKEKFESKGFKDVEVWVRTAPAGMPTTSAAGPFVLGTWTGDARQADLPHQVAEVWAET
jgi:hypothetical protein